MTDEERQRAIVGFKTQQAAAAKQSLAATLGDARRFAQFVGELVDPFADGNLPYVMFSKTRPDGSKAYGIQFNELIAGCWAAFTRAYRIPGGGIQCEGLRLPPPRDASDEFIMEMELIDLVLPYLFERHSRALPDFFYREGPYEVGGARLQPGDVVLDCGANLGTFSAVAAAKNCEVYAFEPMDANLGYLRQTAALNADITVCPVALGERERDTEFVVDSSDMSSCQQRTEENSAGMATQPVHMTTIDNFVRERGLQRVDFIKADIEGAERHMLAGAAETIKRFRPKLSICTYHLPDDPKLLRDMVLGIEPRYHVVEKYMKLYAWCGD